MDVLKFSEYIINEESENLVLDFVIGFDGTAYNGENGNKLIKGYIDRDNRLIYADEPLLVNVENSNLCAAGVFNSGHLKSFIYGTGSNSNYLLVDENPIIMPENIVNELKANGVILQTSNIRYWNKNYNYLCLVPLTGTGWVNTKVDMEVIRKTKRFSANLGLNGDTRSIDNFVNKMNDLQRISDDIDVVGQGRESIQKKMSCIMILHYLKEIKNFFTPGSAGSLFESYIAGLIPNSHVKNDDGSTDIESDGNNYQIKLYDPTNPYIPISKVDGSDISYYIIGLKYPDRVDIYQLDGNGLGNNSAYIKKFLKKEGKSRSAFLEKKTINEKNDFISISLLTKQKYNSSVNSWTLNLLDIDKRISKISIGMNNTLENLYNELSKFQYNIETITTGIDKDGKLLETIKFAKLVEDTQAGLTAMGGHLNDLVGHMGN